MKKIIFSSILLVVSLGFSLSNDLKNISKYIQDSNHVYYNGEIVPEVDINSFKVIRNGYNLSYAKDKKNIFLNFKVIPGADTGSFQVLKNENFAKDKNYVYVRGNILSESDAKTFKFVYGTGGIEYYKDQKKVYYGETEIPLANPNSFKIVSFPFYSKDNNSIFYKGKPIAWSDPSSFKIVYDKGEFSYGKDNNYAYLNGQLIEGSEGNSFKVLTPSQYSKDNKNVYYKGKSLQGADSLSFKILNKGVCEDKIVDIYAKDNKYVYKNEIVLSGINSSNFKILGKCGNYSKNVNSVLYKGNIITGADATSIIILTGSSNKYERVAKDNKHVYLDGYIIPNTDIKSFTLIDSYEGTIFSKDKNNVYMNSVIITGAKPSTFNSYLYYSQGITESRTGYYKDSGTIKYYDDHLDNEIVLSGIDIKTFKTLGGMYAKDSKNVYYRGIIITGADSKSFMFLKNDKYFYFPVDKNNVYFWGKVFEGGDDDIEPKWKPDRKSVKVVSSYIILDKKYVYTPKTVLKNSDSQTFKSIGKGYFKDKNNVYKIEGTELGTIIIVEGADPKTFKVPN